MNAPEKIAMNRPGVLGKLQQARMQLISMPIKKGARNEFAKYNYMELADFLIPTQKIFSELGLVGIVSFTAEIASLTITDLESKETTVITSPMSTASLKGCHEVQNLGAVQTYLRRYLWVAALEIVEHDSIDSAPPVESKTITNRDIDDAVKLLTIAAKGGKESLDAELAKIPDAVKAMIPPSTKKAIAALTHVEVTV